MHSFMPFHIQTNMENYMTPVLVVLAIASWIFYLVKRQRNYWPGRGVTQGPTPLPLLGNMHQRMTADLYYKETEWARQHGKIYGFFLGPIPALMVTDVELVKQILIKDFQHFINRGKPPVLNKLLQSTLLFADDQQWRRVRGIVSPSLTTGRLRGMHRLMSRSVAKLVSYLEKLSSNSGVLETKTVMAGFTIDVIASTSFATETNANDDRRTENQFVTMAKKLVSFSSVKMIAMLVLPEFLLHWLKIDNFLPDEPFNYLQKVVGHILEQRRAIASSEGKVDLLQLMLDAKIDETELNSASYDNLAVTDEDSAASERKLPSGRQKCLTEDEIVANCLIFFIGGFETTQSTISHCLFELARHPDIQEQLYCDLKEALDMFDDVGSDEYYEKIMTSIPLLEAVIKETLRLYPPISMMSRICNTDGYRLGNLVLQKNDVVSIPTCALHQNPEYYPDPYRFKPSRFMPENKHLLVPYTYLPFAAGPRNCIGMRFAYLEVKNCLASILRKFKFSPLPETPEKLTFAKGNSLLVSSPFPLSVQKR